MSTQPLLRDVSGPIKDLLAKLEGDESEFWLKALKKTLRKENPFPEPEDVQAKHFPATIDYFLSLDEMIARGRYETKHHAISSLNFRIEGSGFKKVVFKPIHFGRKMSSEHAKNDIVAHGLKIAKTEHLLAFGAKYPKEQLQHPFVALGSVCEINFEPLSPFLHCVGDHRSLNLGRYYEDWDHNWRFLAYYEVD